MARYRWAAVVASALTCAGLLCGCGTSAGKPISPPGIHPSHTAPTHSRRDLLLGRSVQGRPIRAEIATDGTRKSAVLIVGCIHGNEPAGIAVIHRLQEIPPPRGIERVTVANLNPDGTHAGTRQNADRVDLNRNFPFRWQPIGVPGDLQYSGSHASSEPESRIAERLISTLRPAITIWFHQPLALVDESGGNSQIERSFASAARFPLRRLTRYPGSAAGWQNHLLRHTTAFVVELPPGRLSPAQVNRLAAAVQVVARALVSSS